MIEIWYLLITEKFLFWTFREWEMQSFLRKNFMKRWHLLITEMFLFWTFWDGKYCLFWGKKFIKRWYLLVTEKFWFWAFPWWKMQSFLKQKVNGKMIFTDYWKVLIFGYRKVLVLSFSVMKITVFFSQKVDVKVMFTWSFLAFHDILGPGKYGFSCRAM